MCCIFSLIRCSDIERTLNGWHFLHTTEFIQLSHHSNYSLKKRWALFDWFHLCNLFQTLSARSLSIKTKTMFCGCCCSLSVKWKLFLFINILNSLSLRASDNFSSARPIYTIAIEMNAQFQWCWELRCLPPVVPPSSSPSAGSSIHKVHR